MDSSRKRALRAENLIASRPDRQLSLIACLTRRPAAFEPPGRLYATGV